MEMRWNDLKNMYQIERLLNGTFYMTIIRAMLHAPNREYILDKCRIDEDIKMDMTILKSIRRAMKIYVNKKEVTEI